MSESIRNIIEEKKNNFAKFLENIHLPEQKYKLLDNYIRQVRGSTPELFSYYVKENVIKHSRNIERYVINKLSDIGISKDEILVEEFDKFVKYLELFIYILS